MKSRLPILCTASVILAITQFAYGSSVSYAKVTWNRIPANVVYVDMTSPNVRVTPALAKKGTGSSEGFSSMVNRLQPTVAITGTFFCTRSLQPTGDIIIEGKRMHSGCVGTGLCITSDGRVEFKALKDGRSSGWQGYQTVICAGPTLVRDGKVALTPKSEGFKDPGIFQRKLRVAVGITAGNKLLMVTVNRPVLLGDLAKIMLHLGAVDALDLDGGSSTALYYRGKTISRPGRSLTNLLMVYETPDLYAKYRSELAPNMPSPVIASAPSHAADSVMTSSDPVLSGLFQKPSKLSLVDSLHWDAYRSYSVRHSDLQMISTKPASLN